MASDPFDQIRRPSFATAEPVNEGLRAYMTRIYGLMAGGLAATGLTAWFSLQSGLLFTLMQNPLLFFIVAFAPLGFVFYLSFRLMHMSPQRAQTMFWLYAVSLGLSLGVIFLEYTGLSIARVFLITATAFAALSLYGYTTKRDLAPMRAFLFVALIGIIIAMLVNLFLASPALHFAVSILGVLVFAGLTAYDTQQLREMYFHAAGAGGQAELVREKLAIMGALKLYLDFLNMFLFMLQLLGERR